MDVNIQTTVKVSVEDLAKNLPLEDLIDFICIVSTRFDDSFDTRSEMADLVASNMSEYCARFMLEVIAKSAYRNKR